MNTIINDKSSEMVAFKGTLLVHQTEDDIPLSTYVRDNDDRFELDRDKSVPGVSGYSQHQSRYTSGDYVLVKYVTKKTEYHYAAICSSVDDEDEPENHTEEVETRESRIQENSDGNVTCLGQQHESGTIPSTSSTIATVSTEESYCIYALLQP
ncbi:hypothetical protein FQA39_LY17105 [Lamprigera yunnana]|nr:hypothetical protein FQA39_LY17105 [Lamprigera yunnana]